MRGECRALPPRLGPHGTRSRFLLRQTSNDLGQNRLPHRFRGVGGRPPLNLTLTLLPPCLSLAGHLEREHLDLDNGMSSLLEKFSCVRTSRSDPCRFAPQLRLLREPHVRPRRTVPGPALWDDPSPGAARGNQHHFRSGIVAAPWQRGILDATWERLPGRVGHRYSNTVLVVSQLTPQLSA
jgi:hypothetical protein